jgi:hypothetical protein
MSLKNPVRRPGIDPGTVRLVAQRFNQYATPGLNIDVRLRKTVKEVPKECICCPLKSDLCSTNSAPSSQVVTEEYVSIYIVP